jgi:hypothetical protein
MSRTFCSLRGVGLVGLPIRIGAWCCVSCGLLVSVLNLRAFWTLTTQCSPGVPAKPSAYSSRATSSELGGAGGGIFFGRLW